MNIKELVKEISDFLSLELLKIKSYTLQIVDLFYIVFDYSYCQSFIMAHRKVD
jgi:hypothetical protein